MAPHIQSHHFKDVSSSDTPMECHIRICRQIFDTAFGVSLTIELMFFHSGMYLANACVEMVLE